MPKYTYIAKSQPYQTTQGQIEAESEQDAINKITRMGLFPISVQAEDLVLDKPRLLRLRKISSKDVVLFTRQLSTLIESGVNILNSLNIVSKQTPNKYLRAILNDVSSRIRNGQSFSDSLSAHSYVFSGLYSSMIHSGEVGGNLEQTLKNLADFVEKEEEFKNSIRASLTYPFFIFVVSVLTIIVLLAFVIPRLIPMFEDMGQILPLPTKVLIGISATLRGYWWLIAAIILVLIFLLKRLYLNPAGKIRLDKIRLSLPLLGKISLKTEVSRLMRTLSLLLSSGMTIITAMNISIGVLANQILKIELRKFSDQIAAGASLSKCLNESKFFPGFVTNIVIVGEESGTLEKSLMRIANDYEKEVDSALKTLTRLLEPTIILVMGLIVGFIVISMLLPIFQINLIVR
jgi:type II secretory pathway component PulF